MEEIINATAGFIGWTGAILLVGTYFMLTKGKLNSETKIYQQLNLVAAFMLGWSAISYGAWFSVALNLFWVLVSIYGLIKIKA
jgi:hypothetical protein